MLIHSAVSLVIWVCVVAVVKNGVLLLAVKVVEGANNKIAI